MWFTSWPGKTSVWTVLHTHATALLDTYIHKGKKSLIHMRINASPEWQSCCHTVHFCNSSPEDRSWPLFLTGFMIFCFTSLRTPDQINITHIHGLINRKRPKQTLDSTSHCSSRESHQSIWHEAWLSWKWGMLSHTLSSVWLYLHWCEPRLDHYLWTWSESSVLCSRLKMNFESVNGLHYVPRVAQLQLACTHSNLVTLGIWPVCVLSVCTLVPAHATVQTADPHHNALQTNQHKLAVWLNNHKP